MNDDELQFVLNQFARYYSKAELSVDRVEQREFGVGTYKKIEKRHLSFSSIDTLRGYLVNNTPLYVSHSAAFYKDAAATPIETKGWLGAELIFDLDAHSENKYDATPLKKIKENVIALVEDFITNDFGVGKEHVSIVFSGNRGYHVYVKDPAFFGLGSNERREIVDYVCGTGLDYTQFFDPNPKEMVKRKATKINGPKPNEHGWRGRFANAVIRTLESEPTKISRKFAKEEKERLLFISGIKDGIWSRTSVPDIIKHVGEVVKDLEMSKVLADSAVTHDISRLIRMPGSIHGGAGLIAKPVVDIEKFEPYNDALIRCDEINVEFIEDVPQIEFADGTYGPFKKGEKKELVGSLALFFILKESTKIVFSE